MDRPYLDLTDKVAVITGGSRGIGRAIATAYAEHGADVVIASRKLDNCEAVATEIAEKTGRRTLAVGTHVGKWDECDRLADRVLEEFGRCDILVNNAGMSPLYPNVVDDHRGVLRQGLGGEPQGPVPARRALRRAHVRPRRRGDPEHLDGRVDPPVATEVVYGMAKSGLNAMTVALADAFGPKVRVNCILPGAILTDISEAWSEETKANAAKTPMGRAGYAEDFPGAALFFASEASAWITGTCLRVDGGVARQLGL